MMGVTAEPTALVQPVLVEQEQPGPVLPEVTGAAAAAVQSLPMRQAATAETEALGAVAQAAAGSAKAQEPEGPAATAETEW